MQVMAHHSIVSQEFTLLHDITFVERTGVFIFTTLLKMGSQTPAVTEETPPRKENTIDESKETLMRDEINLFEVSSIVNCEFLSSFPSRRSSGSP